MGGQGSGQRPGGGQLKPHRARLPKRYRPGCIARMDQRSVIARELMGDYDAIVTQHRGGAENVTPLDAMLIESLVFANAWRRRIEKAAIENKALDVPKYVALIDRVHGIAKTIGLARVMKDARTLQQVLAEARDAAP